MQLFSQKIFIVKNMVLLKKLVILIRKILRTNKSNNSDLWIYVENINDIIKNFIKIEGYFKYYSN